MCCKERFSVSQAVGGIYGMWPAFAPDERSRRKNRTSTHLHGRLTCIPHVKFSCGPFLHHSPCISILNIEVRAVKDGDRTCSFWLINKQSRNHHTRKALGDATGNDARLLETHAFASAMQTSLEAVIRVLVGAIYSPAHSPSSRNNHMTLMALITLLT